MSSLKLVDNFGKAVVLGSLVGSGGEGDVYILDGSGGKMVAKIYKNVMSSDKVKKLMCMVRMSNQELAKIAAWPQALIRAHDGGPVGVVMPRVSGANEVHELYSPLQRNVKYPTADWRFLVRVAKNCAGAFESLHRSGVVVGDVNQGNLFVDNRSLVTFIDCDSFQIECDGAVYVCEVGVPHFTPPELQKVKLRDVARNVNHDAFGLAILMFHLLFMGRHPFAGRYSGSGDFTIESAIKNGWFAYSKEMNRTPVTQPPNTLGLDDVTPTIACLFERAFSLPGDRRPSAREWWDALTEFEGVLCRCDDVPGHVFYRHKTRCPWCAIEQAGGPNLFVSAAVAALKALGGKTDHRTIWKEIEAMAFPKLATRLSPVALQKTMMAKPVPDGIVQGNMLMKCVGWVAVVALCSVWLVTVSDIVGYSAALISAVFSFWWFALWGLSPYHSEVRVRNRRLKEARREETSCGNSYSNEMRRCENRFSEKKGVLRNSYDQIENAIRDRDRELADLQANAKQQQRDYYLRQNVISHANLPGIGKTRVSTLYVHGYETAYDVIYGNVVEVPGFGAALTAVLESWARDVSVSFRYNPKVGLPQNVVQSIDVKYHRVVSAHEKHLRHGASELKQIVSNSVKSLEACRERYQECVEKRVQAEIDLREMTGWSL